MTYDAMMARLGELEAEAQAAIDAGLPIPAANKAEAARLEAAIEATPEHAATMTRLELTQYELLIFDLDGTLISSYMDDPQRRYDRWEVLPGRVAALLNQRANGRSMSLVSNQAGVAFGHIDAGEVEQKFCQVAAALRFGHLELHDGSGVVRELYGASRTPGLLIAHVCYADARSRDRRYSDPAQVARRKPSGAMIREAMVAQGAGPTQTLYIGDRPEDEQAAADAGVDFMWAADFFERMR
jgi:D-glycero-D-manno-heptose 1,7-bisphosphate phosphatase